MENINKLKKELEKIESISDPEEKIKLIKATEETIKHKQNEIEELRQLIENPKPKKYNNLSINQVLKKIDNEDNIKIKIKLLNHLYYLTEKIDKELFE